MAAASYVNAKKGAAINMSTSLSEVSVFICDNTQVKTTRFQSNISATRPIQSYPLDAQMDHHRSTLREKKHLEQNSEIVQKQMFQLPYSTQHRIQLID